MERKVSSGAINNGFNWGSQITYPTTQYLAVPPGVGTANMIPSSLIKLNVVSSTRGTFVSISGIRGGGGFWKQHGNEASILQVTNTSTSDNPMTPVNQTYPSISVLFKHVFDLWTAAVKVLNYLSQTQQRIRGDNHSLVLIKMKEMKKTVVCPCCHSKKSHKSAFYFIRIWSFTKSFF